MILKAEAVTKKYFRKFADKNYFYAVNETDFVLKEGAVTEIIGRSGSGKTTFLNILAGLLSPSSGRVMLGDTDIYSLNDKKLSLLRNDNIGVIPQGQTGLDSLTVLENVKLPYILYGKGEDADERAAALLEMVGIAHLADSYPHELSGGEVRRLAIARALMKNPPVILADEPTGDLDDENTEIVFGILRKAADDGASVLLVTHESDAQRYADEIYRMNSGKLEKI
ncbi:MAG: ABC transporter ATP-binding protein [Clostridia bacterium]|nr:ABC transporter ATP-binding protein [Clostridia bacterium]